MTTTTALLIGIVLSFAFILWARTYPDGGTRIYSIGLIVTALLYVAFAIFGGASARSLGLELVGLLLYGGAALMGFRQFGALLAIGWAMHVVWDVALHSEGVGAAYTPDWYPWFCVAFDLVVAGAVLTTRPRSETSERA